MSENVKKYSPVCVYLMVNDGNAALDFYRRAFAADVTETYLTKGNWVTRRSRSTAAM